MIVNFTLILYGSKQSTSQEAVLKEIA